MRIRVNVRGVDEQKALLQKIILNFPKQTRGALYRRGEAIMARSKSNYVPVDLGVLRSTGHVELAPTALEVRMIYGGPAAPYALTVHEHPSEFDPRSWKIAGAVTFHPAGRGPFYLSIPLNEAVSSLAVDIARDLRMEDMIR